MNVSQKIDSQINKLMEMLAVFNLFLAFFMTPVICTLFSIYIMIYTPLYPLVIAYITWIYLDRNTCLYDGRPIKWVKNMKLWEYFINYFPQKFVKTADLPATNNYILCSFPHGIMCSGVFAQLIYERSDFAKAFPGISVTPHTLNLNFYIPFSRELTLALGMCSASMEALIYQLKKPAGHAVSLVIGGSAEAMVSSPGVYRVVLKNRKGFIKLALTTGSALVPIFIFGEVDLYDTKIFPKESMIYKIQEGIRKRFGVAPCLFYGQGPFGIFPHRSPITTVVGKPIPVEKNENPSNETINKIHKRFMEELTQLFEEHKSKYILNPEKTFLIIE